MHAMWRKFAELRIGVWVERVPTAENIADSPSRESYALLEHMRAKRVDAFLDPEFRDPLAWESLSLAQGVQVRQ